MRGALPGVILLGLLLPAGARAQSLRRAGESVVFSCAVRHHVVSICAAPDGDVLQYRFGTQSRIDLAYPAPGIRARAAFTAGSMIFSGGGGAFLRFRQGDFTYTIFNADGNWGKGGAAATASGVAVAKGTREFANFPCLSPASGTMGPDLAARLHLPAAPDDADFDIPDAFLPK